MASRLSLIADQLLLIERELRGLGWWQLESPSEQALGSQQPFCVDTLAFEEWLQWIFLPRMKQLIEASAPLPKVCGIQAMAEQTYAVGPKTRELIRLLGEVDRLISGAD
jgi:uncharacterized protein YqcC (DUF446 family)